MKVLEFIKNNKIDGFEIIPNKIVDGVLIKGLVVNIISNNVIYGINTNPLKIVSGTVLETETNFTINENILSVAGIEVDMSQTAMLIYNK